MPDGPGGQSKPSNANGNASGGTNKGRRHPGNGKGKRVTSPAVSGAKFEGKCDSLKGFTYDCTDTRQGDMFIQTTKEIAAYVGRTFSKYPGDASMSITNMSLVDFKKPDEPAEDASRFDLQYFDNKVKEYIQRENILEQNMQAAFQIILGQCTPAMETKLEGHDSYPPIKAKLDALGLLVLLKEISFNYQSQKFPAQALHEAYGRFFRNHMEPGMTPQTYLERFKNNVEILESLGGGYWDSRILRQVCAEDNLINMDATHTLTEDEKTTLAKSSRDLALATAYIHGAEKRRYGKLKQDLENSYTQGIDKYPRNLTSAHNLLVHWQQDVKPSGYLKTNPNGMAFTSNGEDISESSDDDQAAVVMATNKGKTKDTTKKQKNKNNIICFICDEGGHYSNECPNAERMRKLKEKMKLEMENDQEESAAVNCILSGYEQDDQPEDVFGFVTEKSHDGVVDDVTVGERITNSASRSRIPDTWLLLDNQANVNVFKDKRFLTNFRTVRRGVRINSHAGSSVTHTLADFGIFTVWYDPNGIANILSLSAVEKHFHVTYDSRDSRRRGFVVHLTSTKTWCFELSRLGLYRMEIPVTPTPGTVTARADATALIATVEDKRAQYTARDAQRADQARRIHNMIGRPSLKDYLRMVSGGLIPGCPITCEDIHVAEDIYGPNLGSLKGKTTNRPAPHVIPRPANIPITVMRRYQCVVLCTDVMKINNIPFLMSISRAICFRTAQLLRNQTVRTVGKMLETIFTLYSRRGFRVTHVMGDGQFEPVWGVIATLGAELNICAQNEHIPEAERCIRTCKERTRAIFNSLPFRIVPNLLLVHMVYNATFWLNILPPARGIAHNMAPRAIVLGTTLDFSTHCRAEFGQYVQTHEETDNTMASRTLGAICMGPTGNAQGSYWFFNLRTGKKISRGRWTPLPMPSEVIERVTAFARRDKANRLLTFTRRDNTQIPDTDSDDESAGVTATNEDPEEEEEDPEDPDYIPGVDGSETNDDNTTDEEDYDENVQEIPLNNIPAVDPTIDPPRHPDAPATYQENQYGPPEVADDHQNIQPNEDEDSGTDEEEEEENPEQENEAQENGPRRSQRQRRAPTRLIETHMIDDEAVIMNILGDVTNMTFKKETDFNRIVEPYEAESDFHRVVMTQYSAKQGLRKFGEEGAKAILDEVRQLHEMDALKPEANLTREQKHKALQYLMYLKQKRCGKIKGRGCADGRKQRLYISKEEASSPTVSLEALFITAIIDAKEGRYVATCDVPGAFLQTKMDEIVHVRFDGPMAEALTKISPELYRKHITMERGKPVLYAALQKALYGTLRASLLFWRDLSGFLIESGFELNPYDSCVANMQVQGSQCTVVWHVDDLKISHKNSVVVETLIDMLNGKYGERTKLVVTRGHVHDYLGMTLDYSTPGKVRILMTDYVDKILEDLPNDMMGEANTPAGSHLFDCGNVTAKLGEKDSQLFHHLTAKLLFLCKRARPDLQTAVAFLTTRVKEPDRDDWKKLGRCLKYLRSTRGLVLTLESDSPLVIKWYVDGSFAVHPNMRSHTGGFMTMGRGMAYAVSTKQKLNTRSSTEAELVAVNDVMGQILWTRYFLQAQGYATGPSTIYQDNMSAMLLEKNGRESSSKRTRHINIRYFFVSDRIKSGEVTLEHCPTTEMIGDFFTKPLQGQAFYKFRKAILNLDP